jgi:acetylornithine deacetylase
MAYTSDIPLLSRWGTPLLFGPGSIHVAHTPEEHVSIAELRESVDAYKRIIAELLVS